MSRSVQSNGTVLSAYRWDNNAGMIADVAKLGYLDGRVLDCTWGYGNFWTEWQPDELVGCDLNPKKARDVVADFRCLPFADESFDAIVFDPPYGLRGTPSEFDEKYGTDVVMSWQDRHALIRDGITECTPIVKRGGYLLLKCQDQVCSGKKRWQTYEFTWWAETMGLDLVDRFDLLTTPRPQPAGRRQVHGLQNYSTLLVFMKGR